MFSENMGRRVTNESNSVATGNIRFGKTFLALFGLGLLGVLALVPSLSGQLDALPPELADLPAPAAAALALLNPMILLAVAVAVGTLLAYRVGLRSLVAERVRQGTAIWPQLRPHISLAVVVGLVLSIVIFGLDALINPFAGSDLSTTAAAPAELVGGLLAGLFYGGIVEELLLRWGLMSLLVWIGWRVAQRGQGLPRPALVWMAIVLAALLFGVATYPRWPLWLR
jgi:hypothetical protein